MGSSIKDLYVSTTITQLNKMAETIPKVSNARIAAKSANKLYRAAEEHELLGDEEKAYVFYMRFFNLYTALKKTSDYLKDKQFYDNMFGVSNCLKAIETAEKLNSSLKNRYAELEAKEVAKKLDMLIEKKEEEDDKTETEVRGEKKDYEKDDKINIENGHDNPDGTIAAVDLYKLLLNKDLSIMLMDMRSTMDYAASHIRHDRSINVPTDSVPPGSTTKQIEPKLPAESLKVWKERGIVDYIVILDWYCSTDDLQPGSNARCLKDAIYKWDQEVLVKSEPTLLNGGYSGWLNHYPTITTNAAVERPKPTILQDNSSYKQSLDAIDYDLSLDFLKTPEEKAQERLEKERLETEKMEKKIKDNDDKNHFIASSSLPKELTQTIVSPPQNVPSIDRTKKPKHVINSIQPPLILNNGISSELLEKVDNREQAMKNHSRNANKTSNKLNDLRKQLDIEADEEKPINNTKDSNDEEKATEKEVLVPSINRGLKPKAGKQADLENINTTGTSEESLPTIIDNKNNVKVVDGEEVNKNLQSENKRLVLEHQARLAKLKSEEERMKSIRSLTADEEKKAADVMRLRRQMEEEIKVLQQKKDKVEEEFNKRAEEKRKKEFEEEKIRRSEEEKQIISEKEKREREKKEFEIEEAEKAKQLKEVERRRQIAASEKAKLEEEKRRKIQEEEKALKEKAAQAEKDRVAQLEAAKIKQEKLQKEMMETKRKDAGRKEEEAKRQLKSLQDPSKSISITSTPAGWEKKLDSQTGRYYYIDHKNKTTHWQTPEPKSKVKTSGQVEKAKLKDDCGPVVNSGLKRSHSSPNIAKMLQDEEQSTPQSFSHSVARPSQPKPSRQVTLQTEVSAAKVRNLQPIWGSVKRGLTGLRNLGNTCYMNATLQCLSNTTPLATYFLSDVYREDINRENFLGHQGEVAEEFAVVIKAMWASQYRSIAPRDFKGMVSKNYELFMGFDQQDAQELLLFLMDGLHEDLNRVEHRRIPEQDNDGVLDKVAADKAWKMHRYVNDSIIVELFQGQFKSTVSCLSCEKKSVTFDAFMYLTLPIPSKNRCSLQDCLQQFSKEEKMTGDARWDCPSCKRKRDAVKRIVIWKLPPILLIHLNRFFNQGRWRDKLTSNVDFPLANLEIGIAGPKERPPYTLYGVSNHYGGTMNGGHYTAFCFNPNAKGWFKYDDHEVFEMSKGEIQSPAAYILYYTSMKLDTPFK